LKLSFLIIFVFSFIVQAQFTNFSFIAPGSISKYNSSNLHDISQGADYIIITQPAFMPAAKRLADFRSANLSGYPGPRIKIVCVTDIYNEYSHGLQDPYALQSFVKYAFENWQSPAPVYIVLLGNIGFDNRHLFTDSIPLNSPSLSLSEQSTQSSYDNVLVPNENMIVCIEGDDLVPDLAIGELSCDNLDEANNLVNKIISCSSQPDKNWKETLMRIAGDSYSDNQPDSSIINLINAQLSDEINNKKNNIIGSAILNSKAALSGCPLVAQQLARIILMGDPAAELPIQKTFNNIAEKSIYVVIDSIKPEFSITFDGKEIDNGDVISAKPEILITLKDESPLLIDTSSFTTFKIDNIPIGFSRPDLKFYYTPYPNSQAVVQWNPAISDGKHTLEVYAKDPSGNYFDTSSHKYDFFVYNQPDLINVFNYPNPFKNDTYFTFELHGINAPDELKIKVFTVAGRLIRDITVPTSVLQIGFNKFYWDGRDQDGDEIANGVYFYKIIAKNNGVVKTSIEKLAKIK
jgi:hypothetical protein